MSEYPDIPPTKIQPEQLASDIKEERQPSSDRSPSHHSKSSPDEDSESEGSGAHIPQQQPNRQQQIDQGPTNKFEGMVRSSNKRYKYCCKKCKHTERNKKACVCVVPKGQRMTQIGEHGCQSCGCMGCSFEDYISRGEDPEYHPDIDRRQEDPSTRGDIHRPEARSCCGKCKSCICQQPDAYKKGRIGPSGCKMCGCIGCADDRRGDRQQPSYSQQYQTQQQDRSRPRRSRSRSSRNRRRNHSVSSDEPSYERIDPVAYNFNNFDRSIIGTMIIDLRVNPCLLGFGVPQRTQSYIIGKGSVGMVGRPK